MTENNWSDCVNDDLVEMGPLGQWPVFYHADDCTNYCDYACGGTWHDDVAHLEADAAARLHRKTAGHFRVRESLRASDGSEWALDPGQESELVFEDDDGWWVRFPGGVCFDYYEVDLSDDLFERFWLDTAVNKERNR